MFEYEGIFGLMMAECERKRVERIEEREEERESRVDELLMMAAEVSLEAMHG